jgi:hypothetical protein
MKEHKAFADFFKEIYKGINKFGVVKVLKKLQQLDDEEIDEDLRELIRFIELKVVTTFEITIDQLKNSTERGIVTDARKMCYVLLKNHADFSDYRVAMHFKKVRQVVHRAMKEYSKMSENIPQDRKFLEKLAEIQEDCIEFKRLQASGAFSKKRKQKKVRA